jgi:hypothetical protein
VTTLLVGAGGTPGVLARYRSAATDTAQLGQAVIASLVFIAASAKQVSWCSANRRPAWKPRGRKSSSYPALTITPA